MIIGLSGYAGSGKSTAARIIADMGYVRHKFAAPMKNMIRSLLADQGVTDPDEIERYVEGDLKELPSDLFDGHSPRFAMQTLGTDWARVILGEDYWVNAAMRKVERGQFVVFEDVRFPNEANAIRALGGVVIQINRQGVGPVSEHASEMPPPPDVVLRNDSDIIDLRRRLTALVLEIGG